MLCFQVIIVVCFIFFVLLFYKPAVMISVIVISSSRQWLWLKHNNCDRDHGNVICELFFYVWLFMPHACIKFFLYSLFVSSSLCCILMFIYSIYMPLIFFSLYTPHILLLLHDALRIFAWLYLLILLFFSNNTTNYYALHSDWEKFFCNKRYIDLM